MLRHSIRILLLAAIAAVMGCATTGHLPPASDKADERVAMTGSRIEQNVDRNARFPRTASPMFVITRQDLEKTGRVETGDALRWWPFFR